MVQTSIQVSEFQDLANEKFPVAMGHLRISNMNHIEVDIEVQFGARYKFTVQAAGAFGPYKVLHFMLEAQQMGQ